MTKSGSDQREMEPMTETSEQELARLRQWVNDLQAGCYINCVYCGHRYGPDTEVPASMADVLKAHIEQCPEHPPESSPRAHRGAGGGSQASPLAVGCGG